MKRLARPLLFVAGLAIYAVILRAAGIASLLEHIRQSSWVLPAVVGLYAAVYACNTVAWRCILTGESQRPGFLESYAVTAGSFAINYMTPVVNAGGEPYRIAATAPWIGARRATGATILYYLLHALSSIALWLAALIAAVIVLPRTTWHLFGVILMALGILVLATLIFTLQRRGGLERLLDFIHGVPLLRRIGPIVEQHRASLASIDQQLRHFWREHRYRFLMAFTAEVAGRALQIFEIWLICRGIGVAISYSEAVFISGLGALALNAFFFMPFELGSKEGSLVGLFAAAGYPTPLAMYASVVSRLRELTWIGIGLLLIWVNTLGKTRRVPTPYSGAVGS